MPVESTETNAQLHGGALPSSHDNTVIAAIDRENTNKEDPLPKRSDSIPHMVVMGGEMSVTAFQFQINNAYGMELDGVIHREYENIVEDI